MLAWRWPPLAEPNSPTASLIHTGSSGNSVTVRKGKYPASVAL